MQVSVFLIILDRFQSSEGGGVARARTSETSSPRGGGGLHDGGTSAGQYFDLASIKSFNKLLAGLGWLGWWAGLACLASLGRWPAGLSKQFFRVHI